MAAASVRRVEAGSTTKIVGREVGGAVDRVRTFELPITPHHLAVHWRSNRDARVRVALSTDGSSFGRAQRVVPDEVGEQRRNGETYGSVMPAAGATAVRVWSDRPLGRLSVLAMADGERRVRRDWQVGGEAGAAVEQPRVLSRAVWEADESLRYENGQEVWPPEFHPIQKLIVHHTATNNGERDPLVVAETIRSIYYYHAVTQGWGDIGYNCHRRKVFPNIAGHRDVNATECPGSVFYSTLPSLRQAVADRIAGAADTAPPEAPAGLTATAEDRQISLD